jgi:Ca2+-binding RTX toxin-like protein/methionine-rich copper-binding protein CopC
MTVTLLPINALYLIDSRINLADRARLIADLPADGAWALLDDAHDGLGQIREMVANYSGLGSLHLIGYGSPGSLLLGSSDINLAVMQQHAADLAQIGSHLMPGGDILIYGCNVAQGEVGQATIEQLARLSGADVAASTNPTGAQGDWILEAATGLIQAQALNVQGFETTLDTVSVASVRTANRKPTLSGGIALGPGRTLEIELGGKIYKAGDGKLSVDASTNTWTLNLATETAALALGSYDVQARVVDAKPATPVAVTGTGTVAATNASVVNYLSGGSGNDSLSAASRADVAVLNGNRSDYTISASSSGITVTDNRTGVSAQGTDTLNNLNQLKFADSQTPEFVPQAAQRLALTGAESSHMITVDASKLYNGSKAAETFAVSKNVSAMILAGAGDTVDLSGRITDYSYTSKGSQLQISDGSYTTTVNVGGSVTLRTASGSYVVDCDYSSGVPVISLGGQTVNGSLSTVALTGTNTLSSNAQLVANATGTAVLVAELNPPVILSTSPSDNATATLPKSNIVLNFNEPIQSGAGNIVIGSGSDTRTIDVTDTTQVTVVGSVLTINPLADLQLNVTYNVQLPMGAIKDLAGNNFAGINDPTTLNFTTAPTDATAFVNVYKADVMDPASSISYAAVRTPTGSVYSYDCTLSTSNLTGWGTSGVNIFSGQTAIKTIKLPYSGIRIAGFTPDDQTLVFSFNYLAWADPKAVTSGTYDYAIFAYDIAANKYRLLSHDATLSATQGVGYNTQGTNVTYTDFSADGKWVVFSALDATKLGNTSTTFTDTATTVNDIFVTDVSTGEIRLMSGTAAASIGGAVTYKGLSIDGNTLYLQTNNVAAFKTNQSNFVIDSNGAAVPDLIALRLNLLDLDTSSDSLGASAIDTIQYDNITSARDLKITASLPASSSAILYDNGVQLPNSEAISDAMGVAVWNLSGVSIGSHVYTIYDPTYKKQILLDGSIAASRLNVTVIADSVAPLVSSLHITNTSGLGPGSIATALVNFTEPVFVTGLPTLSMDIGGSIFQAVYVGGSASTSLQFSYAIQAGQNDSDGIALPAGGIVGGAIKDMAGNSIDRSYSRVSDNASAKVDTAAPVLSSANPVGSSSGVTLNGHIDLNFCENVQVGSGNIIISNGVDRKIINAADTRQVTIAGATVTINPLEDFQANSHYTVQIESAAIKDFSGNYYSGISDPAAFWFDTVTVDTVAPQLAEIPILNGANNVKVNTDIVLHFTEAIKAGAGNIIITDGVDTRTIAIGDASQVSINGSTLTINPTLDLWLSTQSSSGSGSTNTVLPRTYSVQIDANTLTDMAGNAFAGISGSNLAFTTASTSLTGIQSTGAASNRVDIVVVGDGYTAQQVSAGTLSNDVSKLVQYFFMQGDNSQPFGRYAKYFNIYAIDVASVDSGIDLNYVGNTNKPQYNTALDSQQSSDTDRLLYVSSAKAEVATTAALAGTGVIADMKVATLNTTVYGGAGGSWASYSQGGGSLEVALHEIGHSYAGLADEYADSQRAPNKIYTGTTDFNLPNATIDPMAMKWSPWIGQYQDGIGVIGAYEGAEYYEKGVYRPSVNSKMQSLGQVFDFISREAFILHIYQNVDPLDYYSASDAMNTSVSVLPIDPTLIDLHWSVDGSNLTFTGSTFDFSKLSAGAHTITLTARDNSGWVRDAYMDQLTQTKTWSVIVPTVIQLDSGNDVYTVGTNGWVNAGDGNDTLIGSVNNDRLEGEGGNDSLFGGNGDDILSGGSGTNIIDGGPGVNTVSYQSVASSVNVNLGSTAAQQTTATSIDTLINIDNLIGGSGNDSLTGNQRDNYIQGMGGNDLIVGGEGNNILDGGEGDDTITADNGNNKVVGGAGQDAITVGNGDNALYGDDGNDTIIAGNGNNHIYGGAGNDQILVGSGANTIDGGDGNDTITGEGGNDLIIGGAGTNILNGGAGSNTLSYAAATVPVTVSLAVTTAQATGYSIDTVSNFQNLIGGSGNDQLTGDANANTLQGGLGNDLLIGGAGNDIYVGGGGDDTVSFAGASQGVVATLLPANPTIDVVTGKAIGSATGEGTDTLWQIANLTGSQYADQLTGDGFSNTLNGGGGADVLTGGAGSDNFVFDSAIGVSQHLAVNATVSAATTYISIASTVSISNFSLRISDGWGQGYGPYFNNDGWYKGSAFTLLGSSPDGSIDGLVASLNASPSYNTAVCSISAGTGANAGKLQISFNTAGGVYVKTEAAYDTPVYDHLTDFTSVVDHIDLSHGIYSELFNNQQTNCLDAALLCQAPQAKTAATRIVYDPSTGQLSYDLDGSGAQAATLFAVLDNKPPSIAASDFLVI